MDSLNLEVVFGRKILNLKLQLPSFEAGNVLRVRHLCEELQLMTGIPLHRQTIVVAGQKEATIRSTDMKRKLNTPLHIVGIQNNSKLCVHGEQLEPWNDDGMRQLENLQGAYKELKKEVDANFHALNLLKCDKEISERSKIKDYQKISTPLLNQLHVLEDMKHSVIEVEVMEENQTKADKLKRKIISNMSKRSEEMEAILYSIKQNELIGLTKLLSI